MIKLLLFLLAASALSLNSCAYRIATPYQLPQGLHIIMVKNEARLVRTQTHLHQAIAAEIQRTLSWPINSQSPNRLHISISEEDIKESAHNAAQISNRWRSTINLSVTLKSPYIQNGSISKSFKASASNSTLADEGNALDDASQTAARQIRSWLEHLPYRQPPVQKQ